MVRTLAARRRRYLMAAVSTGVVAIAVATVSVVSPVADAATIDPAAFYRLVARHSGKALTIAGGSAADGAGLVQQATGSSAGQEFQFVDAGGGFYRLRARHSGKVIDVEGRSTADGANVVQWSDTGATNQQWSVADTDGGHVQLINRNSGKALDVWEWSTADGARTSGGGTQVLAGHGSVHGPGHQAVIADHDGDVLFYHYYANNGASLLGINRIGYDAAGWPFVY